ncbi:MAG: hypothetical protein Hyperionvirus24_13 [Hyperionvirus sp.]|uniref:Uncharacterized protein n=1 Tax=Hyperionvirus sp. TaxID=2487770 RepID=A0A3G5ADP7_9VIRU|nr:MAG: hypothetical protein Hyperionvirus24_13 [Hyperionvirus sp.]
MIRVGRRVYNKDGSYVDPYYENFTKILCLTKSTEYGDIGPYLLKDEKGRIMENIFQFSKVYESVPYSKEYYSRYDKKVIWEYPKELHYSDNKLTDGYWRWRKEGMENKYHVRYPVGFGNRHKCLFAIKENDDGTFSGPLNYVEGRKQIYIPVYCKLVKGHPKFMDLKKRLEKGENLLIIEVDGPHGECLGYYRENYNVGEDFIVGNTMLATPENVRIMLNDTRFPFGHGYTLAMALLGGDVEWL